MWYSSISISRVFFIFISISYFHEQYDKYSEWCVFTSGFKWFKWTFCNLITVCSPALIRSHTPNQSVTDHMRLNLPLSPSLPPSLSLLGSYLHSQEGGNDNYYHNYFQNDTSLLCFNNNHLTEWWQRACRVEGSTIWNPIFLIHPASGR